MLFRAVRGKDISGEDLSFLESIDDLSFDTETIWPDKLPLGFYPKEIIEMNKNPGMGIRELHKEGITGSGVGIAIIDQGLLVDHEEYKDNLVYYEKIHCRGEGGRCMVRLWQALRLEKVMELHRMPNYTI